MSWFARSGCCLFGRLSFTDSAVRNKLLTVCGGVFLGSELFSWAAIKFSSSFIGLEFATYLFQTKPMPPTLLYMISATNTAILVILASVSLAEKYQTRFSIRSLITTGQMALTHYVSHVIIGLGILQVFGILSNRSLTFAVVYSLAYFLVTIAFSHFWQKKFGRGPLETIMRKL
ncbi:DUF418 domain-containing protein [Brevibacillus sp. SYSU BS000544]|uniref:DUF418 domain-containing protein n=1 Tax=Brevibacillus sp. SYSU BS000544 TaxID=3416443 RepID=UPI003CE52332